MKQLVKQLVLIIFFSICISGPAFSKDNSSLFSKTPISSGDCGPKVLQYVIGKITGSQPSIEELISESGTNKGMTTVAGLEEALKARALKTAAVKISIETLELAVKSNPVIIHYSENNHYAVVEKMDDKWIYLYDPAMQLQNIKLPRHLFEKDWTGIAIIASKENTAIKTQYGRLILSLNNSITLKNNLKGGAHETV